MLHRLLGAGDRHPLVVLAILHRHFGNVLRVQSPTITSEAEAAQALGMTKGRSTFPARKALDAARRLGPRATGDAIVALADAELALKGKIDLPPELVLEILVARLCRLSRAAGASAPSAGGSRRRHWALSVSRRLSQPRPRPRRPPTWRGLAHERGLAVGGLIAVDDAPRSRLVEPLHGHAQVLGRRFTATSRATMAVLILVLTSDFAALLRSRAFSLVPIRFIWLLMFATGCYRLAALRALAV